MTPDISDLRIGNPQNLYCMGGDPLSSNRPGMILVSLAQQFSNGNLSPKIFHPKISIIEDNSIEFYDDFDVDGHDLSQQVVLS